MTVAKLQLWPFLAAALLIFGHILVLTNSLPLLATDEDPENEVDEVGSQDVVDPSEIRSKRQVDYYNSYYYDNNLNNNNNINNNKNNCGFRRYLTGLGLGINSYYSPYSSSSSSSGYRNRRLVRNRQPFLYNGRRGLYAPSRYFNYYSTSTSSSNNNYSF